jgi:hypothetical protein
LRAGARVLAGALIALFLAPARVLAGPPYTTDDPEPTDTGHWENRVFVSGLQSPGETFGEAGLDINYGAAKNLQLTLVAPLAFDHRSHTEVAPGTVALSAKYKFVHQSDHSLVPDVGFFPQIDLPTQARGFGPTRLGLFLPLWAQKDFGAWSTFGGGGYDINPGPGNRNFILAGWAVTRQVTKRLNLGAEIYHETAQVAGAKALTAVAAGAVYQLTPHFALMASAGPAVQAARQAGQGVFYLALQFTQ